MLQGEDVSAADESEQYKDGNEFAFQCRPPLPHSGDAWPGTPKVDNLHISLQDFDKNLAALGDRLVKAADASEATRGCGSFFNFGDYTWCGRAMPAETAFAKENRYGGNVCNASTSPMGSSLLDVEVITQNRVANQGQYVGLSYGIEETDPWSEMMSNMYFVNTRLFDCYIQSTIGPMFNNMNANHSRNDDCKGRQCYSIGYEANRVCLDTEEKTVDGYRFLPLSASLHGRPPLSAFVKMDVEGYEWNVLEQLLKSKEDMDRIRHLDMELHMTYNINNGISLERRVEIMEELAKKFAVTGSQIEPLHAGVQREFEQQKSANASFQRTPPSIYTSQGMPLEQYTISFVNRKILNG